MDLVPSSLSCAPDIIQKKLYLFDKLRHTEGCFVYISVVVAEI